MSIASRIRGADPGSGNGIEAGIPESFWRSLKQLNAFRFLLAIFFAATIALPESFRLLEVKGPVVQLQLALFYFVLAIVFRRTLQIRRPSFSVQLVVQLTFDIVLITTFIYLSGSNSTGLELLMTVPMAAAGLHPRTRITFVLATFATLAVVAEQYLSVYRVGLDGTVGSYVQIFMLAVGFYTVAGISHLLAKGALASDVMAVERERAASELERISAQVIQDLPYGVLVLGPEGRVVLRNQQAERLLGMTVAAKAKIVDYGPELSTLWRNWVAHDGTGTAVLTVGEPMRRVRARLNALDVERAVGAVMFVEDMSELEHEAMQMKLASLGRLTASLAHEIRNPLSAINHASQLLREDAGQDRATNKLTRIIEDNVVRLNYLVEDVLLLSRRGRKNREPIPLAEFLAEFVVQFRQSENVAEEVFCLSIEPGLIVDFDRMHLHQILWNLARNAFRHCSREPCSIRINAAAVGDMAQIEIYNDGPAIPADMRQRLFEPFYSTDRSGTGLGLYIALELTETNEGNLRCLEQAQGACFRLSAKLLNDERDSDRTDRR